MACTSCGRPLCDACFRFTMGERAACALCAYEAATRPQRRVSLAVTVLLFTFGGGGWLVREERLWQQNPAAVVGAAALGVLVAAILLWTATTGSTGPLAHREPGDPLPGDDDPAGAGPPHPYRALARRAILAVSPRLSGKLTALVVLGSMALAAVLVPASLGLPRWIEAQLVLAAWWLILAVTLVILLYRGFRLRDDLVVFLPWNRPKGAGTSSGSPDAAWLDGCSVGGEGEGCAFAFVALVLVVAFYFAAWLLVELALPIAGLLAYSLFMRAVGRVAGDRHGCAGDLTRSCRWGIYFATLYLVPLAGLTWLVHALRP